jgi:hypothetical protein
MRAIGITIGFCSLLLMMFQTVRLFISMEQWNSSDFLLVTITMSFLSTAFIGMGSVLNKD